MTALVRDDRGHAISDLPLKLTISRPDGVVAREFSVRSDETGAVPHDHLLPDGAITGDWHFGLSVPGGGATVGETSVQVEDFVPPRIEVSAGAPAAFFVPEKAPITLSATAHPPPTWPSPDGFASKPIPSPSPPGRATDSASSTPGRLPPAPICREREPARTAPRTFP